MATIDAAAIAALLVSPSTTARCAGASGPEPETVDEARLRARREIGEHGAQPPEVRAVEAVAVDVAGRDHANRHLRRRIEHRPEKRSRTSGSTCLESFSSASGRVRSAVERVVVEQDAGDDERSRERAPARLVRAGDEADAEPAVVAEKPLAGRERIAPRISADPERVRDDFVSIDPQLSPMRQNGRMQPALRRSSTTSQPAFSVSPDTSRIRRRDASRRR